MGFSPLPILLCMAEEHIQSFSQFSRFLWLSYSSGTSSVILTHEYFGILWGISRMLITAPFYLFNFRFLSIKFLAGLPNTLKQHHHFRLTTILVFPIHYKLCWSIFGQQSYRFVLILLYPFQYLTKSVIAHSKINILPYQLQDDILAVLTRLGFTRQDGLKYFPFLPPKFVFFSGINTSQFVAFLWMW